MNHSESIKEIAVAMNKAQSEITAAKKDSANPFFKSSYADLGSVIKAVKLAMSENGLSYMQAPEMSEHSVGVTTLIMHTSGEWVQSSLMLPLQKMDPQAAGSAITYARRYALQSLMGLPAADDDAEFAMARLEENQPIIGITSGQPLDKAKLERARDYVEGLLHADTDEPDYAKMQAAFNRLSPDEQVAVMDMFGDKKLGRKNYRTVINDCLKMALDPDGKPIRDVA